MLAACRFTYVSALLASLVAAEWVEISQQRYRKPIRYDSHPLQEQTPNKYTPDALAPAQHPFLNHNAPNPMKSYQDVDSRNTYLYHDVSLEDSISDDSFKHDVRPALNRSPDQKTDRLNPFKENSEIRNTYDYVHVLKNKHFRPDTNKPMSDDFPSVDDLFFTSTKETYANHSIKEHNWYQNNRQQNNLRDDTKVPTKEPIYNDRTQNSHQLSNARDDRPNERSKYAEAELSTETRKEHGSISGKIERVSNVGTVKRVHLANTPVKSPSVKIPENPIRRHDIRPINTDNYSDELDLETNDFKNTGVEKESVDSFKNLNKGFRNTEKVDKAKTLIANGVTPEKDKATVKNTEIYLNSMNKHRFISKPEIMAITTETAKGDWRHQDASIVDKVKQEEINKQAGVNNKPSKTDNILETNTKEQIKANDLKSNLNANSDSVEYENIYDEEGNKASLESNKKTSGDFKVNTMENILKFIKVVAETISKNTKRGEDGKITYLNELKHSLLTNIKERLDAAWPEAGSRRRSRSARGHVEFPSSESALMTISFLTFAVFLIKLVLQVIQTYKHKTMLMAPLVVATAGRTLSKKLRANT